MTQTGLLYDCLIKRFGMSRGVLCKVYNSLGSILPAVFLCSFSLVPQADRAAQLAMLTLTVASAQLSFTGGFYVAMSDFAGPFTGVVFGLSNTAAQIPGFLNPTIIALLAPNVRWDY